MARLKSSSSNWLSGALIVALLIGAIVMGFEEMHSGLPDDVPAPAFSFEKLGGGRVTSSELVGKVVILDFWATWCPPCREEMPWLVKLAEEYQSKGVAFVAASDDEAGEAKAAVGIYVDQLPGLRPYAAFGDPAIGARYKVRALPTIYILDRQGKIVASHTGQTSERSVRRWLDDALERK